MCAQSCPALCSPTECSPPGSSVHGIFQPRVLEWVCHFLLQRIFPTQGSNLGLLYCRQTLYPLSHQGRRRPQFNSWVRKIPWRKARLPTPVFLDFPGGSDGKFTCSVGDLGSIPGVGRSTWTEEPGRVQSTGSQRVRHD